MEKAGTMSMQEVNRLEVVRDLVEKRLRQGPAASRMLVPHSPDRGDYRVSLHCLHCWPPIVRWAYI